MTTIRRVTLLVAAVALSGCYRFTVVSGAPAGQAQVAKSWQKSWVYGLVPPDTLSTQSTCPRGVASVETVHSFPNMLVSGLTWGIFSPMSVKAVCASGPVAR